MSLFGAIQMGGNSLRANDIALQVVGQNISNANTPGYIREEVLLKPAATQRLGNILLGLGVDVEAVVQKVDKFLQERLRGAVSDSSSSNVLEQTYSQLEGVVNALSDNDLSTSMNAFFNSISEILNQPDDVSVRNLAVLQGESLAQNITQMTQRVEELHDDLNNRVQNMAGQINQLTEQISKLNVKISETQGGSVSKSDAVGLTDQRFEALENLAELMSIQTVEQTNGSVTVYCGGNYLVSEGTWRPVEAVVDSSTSLAEIHLSDTDSLIDPASGELRGLLDGRDQVLGGFLDQLNDFTRTLIFEFNKVYSSGQGLNGYSTLTSASSIDDASQPLNNAGLSFTPQNGSFQVLVSNKKTGLTQTTNILVDLNGMGHDMTLNDLSTALDGIDGISAEILVGGQLKIDSDSADNEFAFANDTSGVLAALGMNVFFTGDSAYNVDVSEALQDDPAKFAASKGGLGADTDNAAIMANFIDQPIQSHNGETLGVVYDRIIADLAQSSSQSKTTSDGSQAFEGALRGQQMSISSVNLDEEAIKMITYQRAYQASAKFIATIKDLLEVLVSI